MSDTKTTYVAGLELSDEMIQAMKNGYHLNGSRKEGINSNVYTPSQTYNISEGKSDVMPVIRDESGAPIRQEKVTKANFSHHTTADVC